MEECNALETVANSVAVRPDATSTVMTTEKLMDMSMMLAKSTIVPVMYQNRPENCFVALDMASRMGLSPMVVMQNLFVIQGKPSWSGQAIASMIRANPNYRDVELHFVGQEGTDQRGAFVTAHRISTGKTIVGSTVTLGIAKKEGWYQKSGSKWQTIPEVMLSYRAYAWFGRVHCPELMMGMQTVEEVQDVIIEDKEKTVVNPFEGGGK
jgi:hypothetical protein